MCRAETASTSTDRKLGPGALVLVVGPSGAGKDTLIGAAKALLAGDGRVVFPRRTITRAASPSEDNESIDPARFDQAVAAGAFALWWRAHDLGYGIPRTIDDRIGEGCVVVANVSRTVVAQAREKYRSVVLVLITAPPEVLAERLVARGRDPDIGGRLQRAALDVHETPDVVISNVGPIDANARKFADLLLGLERGPDARIG